MQYCKVEYYDGAGMYQRKEVAAGEMLSFILKLESNGGKLINQSEPYKK